MRIRFLLIAAVAAMTMAPFVFSPTAMGLPFANCDQAEAAGAAPIFAGQPGYNADRDGDGVACETSSRGSGPAPLTPQAPKYTTYISWGGTDCIVIRYPNGSELVEQTACSPERHTQVCHTALSGQLIGADPEMGPATAIACLVSDDATFSDIFEDAADAGDGTDVNCIIPAP
jgi:hypothetical protein